MVIGLHSSPSITTRNYLLEVNILTEELTQYFELDFDSVTSPDYDGSGERIIFSALKEGQADLYIIELQTGEVDRLTFDPFNDTHPSWHPTTRKIVYTSERGGKNRLVLIDLDRGTERLLTDGTYNAISPVWTPGGKSILFCSDGQGIYDIYKLEIVEKAHTQTPAVTKEETQPKEQNDTITKQGLLFTENGGTELANQTLKVKLTRLTNMMTGCFNPSFSPNGKRLLFSAYQNGKYDVCVMETSKTIEEKVEVTDLAAAVRYFNSGSAREL